MTTQTSNDTASNVLNITSPNDTRWCLGADGKVYGDFMQYQKDTASSPTPPDPTNQQGVGMKYDGGKPRWSLMMQGLPKFLDGIAAVLTFGAKKYAAHSWRTVPEGYERYRDALYRHLAAIERGEYLDPESGLPHWHHVGCNAGFCSELAQVPTAS